MDKPLTNMSTQISVLAGYLSEYSHVERLDGGEGGRFEGRLLLGVERAVGVVTNTLAGGAPVGGALGGEALEGGGRGGGLVGINTLLKSG